MTSSTVLVPYRLEDIGKFHEVAQEVSSLSPLRVIWEKEAALLLLESPSVEGDTGDPITISDILEKCDVEKCYVSKYFPKWLFQKVAHEQVGGLSPVAICTSRRSIFFDALGVPASDKFFGVPVLEDDGQAGSVIILVLGTTTLSYLYGASKIVYIFLQEEKP